MQRGGLDMWVISEAVHGSHLDLTQPGPAGPQQGVEKQTRVFVIPANRAAGHGLRRQQRAGVSEGSLSDFLASSAFSLREIWV